MAEIRTIAGAIKLAYENKTEIDKIKENGGADGISDKLKDVIEKVDNIGQVKDTDDIQIENASDKDYYINTGDKIVQTIIVDSDEEKISLASEEVENIIVNTNVMNLNNNQVKKTTITMSLNNGGD